MKFELSRRGIHCIPANNDVENGIQMMTSEMAKGNLFVCSECDNTIREIESYCWDTKAAERGYDEPVKRDDHSCDALRYVMATHKVAEYKPFKHQEIEYDAFRSPHHFQPQRPVFL